MAQKVTFVLPNFEGEFLGGGTVRKGRDIYRVTLRDGMKPQCTISGEDYVDPPGQVDTVMWELLVAVRQKFAA